MYIALVGPGIMSIPPKGWGAVEILIWDYYQELIKLGHTVEIINTPDRKQIINNINSKPYDFVHIHYDVFYDVIPNLECKNIGISSHYPYIDQPEKYFNDGFQKIFDFMIQNESFYIFSISKKDYDVFYKFCKNKEHLFLLENGICSDAFKVSLNPKYQDKTIFLAKVEPRKRQYLIKNCDKIDIIGVPNYECRSWTNYRGEWSRENVYSNLTEYGNLILLSTGENGPLVVKEALMSGIGVILSESSTANIDISLPFIDVIPESKIEDKNYILNIVEENRNRSKDKRLDIRKYAEDNFSFSKLILKYISNVSSIIDKKLGRKERIVIVGPGIMPIPPKGWGAVEILIWDYYCQLKERNVDVHIVNEPTQDLIVKKIHELQPTIVHIQYDDHIFIVPKISNFKIIYTTHYAYLAQENVFIRHGYARNFFESLKYKDKIYFFVLSEEIRNVYIKHGVSSDRVIVMPNGASDSKFTFSESCLYPNKSIYLAKIDERKSQYKYQNFDFIDFVGNKSTLLFDYNRKNYIGEWDKDKLYKNLTNYSNLILLSDGEAHPLVVCEALICGLGVVVSSYASANLDITLPWITVIPNEKLNDLEYVKSKILENQKISVLYRNQIREYGLKYFSWNVRITDYLIKVT